MHASNQYGDSDSSYPFYYPQEMGSQYSDPRSGLSDYSLSSCSTTALYPSQSDHTYGSPISSSSPAEDLNHHHHLQHKMNELEKVVIGPEQAQMMQIPFGDLKQMLIACASAIADNNIPLVELLTAELRLMVSVSGDPIQRLGAYLLEGLVARLASSGSCIYRALKCREPASSDLLSYMHLLYEVCPYFKFGYMSANGAIAEALKGEIRVHVIDFQIAMGTQWVTLIQALAARPGGPPHVRITGIDDPVSAHARGGGLQIVGRQLAQLAKSCGVPFEFHGVAVDPAEVEAAHLGVRPGEALAVNFAYQLHHIPDESVSTWNHRDRVLRMVKGLSPKVVTLVEQESNTNTAPFLTRFIETLSFYTAIFESIDERLPRESKERISVEQHCLARDIVNIIACEGAERMERHELLGKWKLRFSMAGFSPCPLSPVVNATIKSLLENYCEHYRLEERDGALYLGWKNRVLVVSSAWR
ncbi:scarecrow-like protein 21 [Wolffia australiana]